MKTIILIGIISINVSVIHAMNNLQRTIIPSFLSHKAINTIRQCMDTIEQKNLGYPDYEGRTGIIWTDFLVNTKITEIVQECKDTKKVTEVNGKLQRHNPQSMFSYPEVQAIVTKGILPKMFEVIETNGWAQLPPQVFAQLYIQRCHTSNAMLWHQDPGEDYSIMADYSLVLMLSDQENCEHGWEGGIFKIKSGLPTEECSQDHVETIIHKYNQVILFNNKSNSHMVTAVMTKLLQTKRDLLVIPIYFGEAPKPVADELR